MTSRCCIDKGGSCSVQSKGESHSSLGVHELVGYDWCTEEEQSPTIVAYVEPLEADPSCDLVRADYQAYLLDLIRKHNQVLILFLYW